MLGLGLAGVSVFKGSSLHGLHVQTVQEDNACWDMESTHCLFSMWFPAVVVALSRSVHSNCLGTSRSVCAHRL